MRIRAELRRLEQLSGEQLAQEDVFPLDVSAAYPILTPLGSSEAADALRQMLESEGASSD